MLESEVCLLRQRLEQLFKHRDDLLEKMKQMPTHKIGDFIVRESNEVDDRFYVDALRQIHHLQYELQGKEWLLQLQKPGRPREAIYQMALQELEGSPRPTYRELARKYLPQYFPGREGYAIEAMRKGIMRAKKSRKQRKQAQ